MADLFQFLGVLGMAFIVIAWMPQTLATIRTKRVGMEEKFLWFYLLGCMFLALYAFYIMDYVFLGLNSISFLLNSINIYYFYRYEKKLRRFDSKRKKK